MKKFECLKCGAILDEHSRPHIPPETPGDVRRNHLRIVGEWSNYEDMPQSMRTVNKGVCWGVMRNLA